MAQATTAPRLRALDRLDRFSKEKTSRCQSHAAKEGDFGRAGAPIGRGYREEGCKNCSGLDHTVSAGSTRAPCRP